jgi:ribonuclease P/MRP protein subunit RPP40
VPSPCIPTVLYILEFLFCQSAPSCATLIFLKRQQLSTTALQGSVLGPLMFLVYISDLTLQLRSRHALFADDCKIYGPADKANEIKSDLAAVQTWCDVWKMKLNVDKCSVLHIGVSNPKTNYTVAGKILAIVQQQKDLGVVLTSTLSWSEHVATTVCRVNFVVHTLKKSFQRVNEESFVKLYSSYVRPILEYANLIWAPVLKRDIDLLEKVQRRATKIVHGLQNKQY